MGLMDFVFGRRDRAPELGLTIGIQDDGFTIKPAANSSVSNGDSLLVAYKTASLDWIRREIEYNGNRDGMFVFTGDRPVNVIVLARKALEETNHESKVPVYTYSADSGSTTSSCSLNDLYDPFSPASIWSPFRSWNPGSPLHFLNLFQSTEDEPSRAAPVIPDFGTQALGMDGFRELNTSSDPAPGAAEDSQQYGKEESLGLEGEEDNSDTELGEGWEGDLDTPSESSGGTSLDSGFEVEAYS